MVMGMITDAMPFTANSIVNLRVLFYIFSNTEKAGFRLIVS